jgi:hypothetical protein
MVAHSAHTGSYAPLESPRVAVAGDGTLAAIHEPARVTILEIPSGVAFAEIGVDPEAVASEVAWVGVPPRLLVVSRYAAHSTVHLLDPHGPHTIAEIRLESPMRLFATVGSSALVVGALGAAVLIAGDSHLMPYQFPARAVPVTAGAAAGLFVVALAGSIEEWDPQSRMPKRRLRLPRAAAITAVGGSERLVWMTTQQEPARIDVIPLVNRGQPKAHDLPEPIAAITGHPRSDLVACIGADTCRLYVIDLDGRARMRMIDPEGGGRIESAGLVVGRMSGVVAAQSQRPIAIVAFDRREADEPAPEAARQPVTPEPPPGEVRAEPAAAPVDALFRHPVAQPAPARAAPPAARPAPSVSERFSAWRDLVRQSQPREPVAAAPPPGLPVRNDSPRSSWRDDVVAWSRAVVSGAMDHAPVLPPAPAVPAIDALVARFDLAPQLQAVLVLLYGAHLCGQAGIAPVDVARVLDHQWDEALGRGELAQHGLARHAGSRVALVPAILRVLDELPPTTGTLVGEPGSVALLGPCVAVAGDEPLTAVAERCAPHVGGAVLVGRDDADRDDLLFEARARGVAAMLRAAADIDAVPNLPAIFVVGDAELADRLGVPRLA